MTGAICIASGPSLTLHDVILCATSGRTIYVVNDAYKIAPWADVLYAADSDWWDYHEGVKEFMGERWGLDPRTCERWGLNQIAYDSKKIFATEPPIATGSNSGFQAINLAYLQGHRDIWLLGYDMGHDKGSKKHFFGEHPAKINRPSQYQDWLRHFRKAAPVMKEAGLKIVNMSRKTALDCFERGDLCEFT